MDVRQQCIVIFADLFSRIIQKGTIMNSIRFVPTWLHGYFDYIGGVGLIAAPFVFGFFNHGGMAVILPMVLGVVLILYSLLTNYERGIPGLKFIPMTYHLVIDFLASALLAVSPFLFGFYNANTPNVWLPHLIAGVTVIILVLVSQTRPRAAARAKAVA
jgi:hypothetical protein